MADPTIQTFCCHHGNGTDIAVTIMEEFNSDAYNGVCLFSSSLGILGAIYQILPRQQYVFNHRWASITAARGRKIIIWLAVADLFASLGKQFLIYIVRLLLVILGVFTRSSLWINYKNIMPAIEDDSSVLFCAISSAWIQYFYTATWIWTLCYSIDMRLVLSDKEATSKYYHTAAWFIPAFLTTTGLSLLYIPDAKYEQNLLILYYYLYDFSCHTSKSLSIAIFRILPNYIVTYVPITLVMIANPWLYKSSCKDMERVITTISGQFTSREREIIDAIEMKFLLINLVFYVCWIPNLINGILLWILWFDLPAKFIISVWYIMAFLNPLQALFNCMVYRRWHSGSEKVVMPWNKCKEFKLPSSVESRRSHTTTSTKEESVPLLENIPRSYINGYT